MIGEAIIWAPRDEDIEDSKLVLRDAGIGFMTLRCAETASISAPGLGYNYELPAELPNFIVDYANTRVVL